MTPNSYNFQKAIQDFQSAQQKAAVQEILARVTGRSTELISYDEVAEKLKLHARMERGIQNIPLDAIVGSVGRNTEFTRTFLPRRKGDQQRWARVKAAMQKEEGLPPIEVYKVGEVYFVIDGNHRVSIARQEKFPTIEARVIEFTTEISLTPDIQPDDLIIKAEQAEFLKETRIHELRPNVDLTVTAPSQYEKILREICAQEFLLERERKNLVEFQEAVESWYDNVYIPLAEAIRDRGLLRWFPGRTITDLYVWISEHRAEIEKEVGWRIQSDIAATDLILDGTVKPEPGSWRKARTASRYTDNLFMDILVPLSGDAESWDSLEQAITIARRENAKIHGLHIVESKEMANNQNSTAVQALFNKKCVEAGVEGKLGIEVGGITKKICERATMTDLIVLKIVHPPMGGLSSLKSPFRAVIENSSRPILGIPSNPTNFKRALLAYDGTDLAREALFVATYLAEIWKTELMVFTALDGKKVTADLQEYVRRYLDIHEVEAEYIISEQSSKDFLKQTVDEQSVDLVLMGSHGGTILRQVLIGSTLDYMLRESNVPIFICR